MHLRILLAVLFVGLVLPIAAGEGRAEDDRAWTRGPMRIGIGDRLTVLHGGKWVPMVERMDKAELRPDYLEFWLTRGWRASWIPASRLRELEGRGITPVFVHYFFGDEISAERIREEREEWHASLRRMARVARGVKDALIVLEPEFNIDPPVGETATLKWAGFADEIRRALQVIRAHAPQAKIGICAGDFYPDLNLEVLDAVAGELDFLAFQEMRGSSDALRSRSGYLRVGWDAVRYARYLRKRFRKPILLAYVAVSSYGGWDEEQADALRDLADAQGALREQGVFGVIYFQLQDDPEHVGYFGPAERHFGLVTETGHPKPALHVFRGLMVKREAHRDAAPPRRTPSLPTPR